MAASREVFHDRKRHRALDLDFQALHHLPARRIAGGLRLLPRQQHAHQRLHVPLRLHEAAHHAERSARAAVLVTKPE